MGESRTKATPKRNTKIDTDTKKSTKIDTDAKKNTPRRPGPPDAEKKTTRRRRPQRARRKTAGRAEQPERSEKKKATRRAEPGRSEKKTTRRAEPGTSAKKTARRAGRGGTAKAGTIRGRYVGHPRGFGFLVVETTDGDEDIPDRFVPPGHEGAAIDGDTVSAKSGPDGTARVTRVERRGRPLLSGTFLGKATFAADAQRVPNLLSVTGNARKGDKVLIEATETGFRIRQVLGRAGAPDVEDAAVLAELEISPGFPKPVITEAGNLKAPGNVETRDRMDLRDRTTVVTIDPVTSRDFDDAISLERRGKDWLLGVHIADVSHYVTPKSALDREAHQRGTSVYLPSTVIPMLPEKLSNDLCSLREGVDRLTMSVLLRYDADGKLKETTFAESVIRSDRRFSYERASRVMDRSAKSKGDVGRLLLDMAGLAAMLRRARPSLDIPRSEVELVYSGQGDVVDVHPTAQDVAHGVIEEFMLAANREVARLLLRRQVATLFRHHPAPADLSEVWDALRDLEVVRSTKGDLKRAIAKAVDRGFGPAVSSAMLKCMPRAIYTTAASTHFSLGFEAYAHFTSPIRRYSDLIVHRQLRTLIRKNGGPIRKRPGGKLPRPVVEESLETLAQHVTNRSAAADSAESRIRRRRVLELLLRLGRVPTEGQITSVTERGFSVELPDYGTWGFVPADTLPGGPYQLEGPALRAGRRTFRLGEVLTVAVDRIDPASGRLDLALAQQKTSR